MLNDNAQVGWCLPICREHVLGKLDKIDTYTFSASAEFAANILFHLFFVISSDRVAHIKSLSIMAFSKQINSLLISLAECCDQQSQSHVNI